VFFRATDSLVAEDALVEMARGAGLDAAPCVPANEPPPPSVLAADPAQLLGSAPDRRLNPAAAVPPVQARVPAPPRGPMPAPGKAPTPVQAPTPGQIPVQAPNPPMPPAAAAPAPASPPAAAAASPPAGVPHNPRVAELARHVAMQRTIEDADVVLSRGLAELLSAKRVQIIYRHPDTGRPFGRNRSGVDKGCIDLAQHIFASRRPVSPKNSNDFVFAFPVLSAGEPVAVCILIRAAHTQKPFALADANLAAVLSTHVAPTLQVLLGQFAAEEKRKQGPAALFREEAVAFKNKGRAAGEVVRISPRWLKSTFWFMMTLAVFGIGFLVFVKVDRSSVGPALVRVQGDQLTARVPATVSSVLVHSSQHVHKGDLLVELYSAEEIANLHQVETEYRTKLATYLLGQGDVAVRADLASTAAQRQRAISAVSQKSIRAPRDGLIRDLRVRPGMPVNPGDHIATIEQVGSMPELVAFLPGNDRPQLAEGMVVKLAVPGYQTLPVTAKVFEVGTEVVGPAEARRLLGGASADSLPIEGPVTIVRARLDSNIFADGDKEYEFHDGMPLEAEVVLESERMILALIRGAL
jgi:membrane fusion protein (multidrug efflux system)